MKLGVFDSGLGGLLIAKAIRDHMPDIDLVYLGDTLRLPYGNRSDEAIYRFSERAIRFLLEEQDCALVITACNTVSAKALRRLQQECLPAHYPEKERNVIGVVVPTLETAIEGGYKNLGVIGTEYTIQSNIYLNELHKIDQEINILQKATPLLVPLIEHDGARWSDDVIAHYTSEMRAQKIECLILGCTHYPFLKKEIAAVMGPDVKLLSQDDIIPAKLSSYLERHTNYNEKITRQGQSTFLVTDNTEAYQKSAARIYGAPINIQEVTLK